jgi:hypothetical protein
MFSGSTDQHIGQRPSFVFGLSHRHLTPPVLSGQDLIPLLHTLLRRKTRTGDLR